MFTKHNIKNPRLLATFLVTKLLIVIIIYKIFILWSIGVLNLNSIFFLFLYLKKKRSQGNKNSRLAIAKKCP